MKKIFENKEVVIYSVKSEYTNETIQLQYKDIAVVIRIACQNMVKRINAKHERWEVINVYYENSIPVEGYFSSSYEISKMTNLFLFIERHKQWLLEIVKG